MEETAYAKINLALHVRGREPDGYHRIETLFAFAEHGDLLTVSEGSSLALAVEGPFAGALAEERNNLVLRAAQALADHCRVDRGAALRLVKNLPIASGIGGGSADAAATLRLLARWWGLGAARDDLTKLAADIGADVPACLLSQPARGEGRGDRLMPLDHGVLAGTPLLLVNPGTEVSTAAVFRAWDGVDRGGLPPGDPLQSAIAGRNDLAEAAVALAPEISAIVSFLETTAGARLVRMSGSGATCFALYGSVAERDEAKAAIAARAPQWWCLSSRIRS